MTLEQRVAKLEQAQNLNAIQALLDFLIKDTSNVTDNDVTLALSDSVPVGGGTVNFNVLDFPDRWIELRLNGEIYRIPAYLKRLDSSR